MIFIILALLLVALIFKYVRNKYSTLHRMYAMLIAIVLPMIGSLLLGAAVTELYYASDFAALEYEEIDLHPETSIELEQYVKQEPIILMDKDHNLYHVDLGKAEITFSTNNDAAYIKTLKAKGLWKFIVFDQSRTSFAVQFVDYYARYSS